MRFIAGCWRPRLAGLVVATSLLAACATVSSEPPVAVCPPVVEYSREFQARAADELALLPARSAIAEMLSDYAVMSGRARTFAMKAAVRPPSQPERSGLIAQRVRGASRAATRMLQLPNRTAGDGSGGRQGHASGISRDRAASGGRAPARLRGEDPFRFGLTPSSWTRCGRYHPAAGRALGSMGMADRAGPAATYQEITVCCSRAPSTPPGSVATPTSSTRARYADRGTVWQGSDSTRSVPDHRVRRRRQRLGGTRGRHACPSRTRTAIPAGW